LILLPIVSFSLIFFTKSAANTKQEDHMDL
jgi:hypothetical protein